MTKQIARTASSPFESIRLVENGQEYWSARALQTLMGYTEWRKFEDALERAMIACKNSGHPSSDHFVLAAKMVQLGSGSRREVEDYHLTRYACYLAAMNSDPRKEAVSQAQTYFALKTREAEVAQQQHSAMPQEPAPTLCDALRERTFLNEGRVPAALFSTQCELTRELHYLEAFLNETLDNKASLEGSVGKCFSSYARSVLHLPDSERRKYRHRLPSGRIVEAWAYPIGYLPDFRRWLYEVYIPVKFKAYRRYRARCIGAAQAIRGGVTRKLIAQRRVEQLPLF